MTCDWRARYVVLSKHVGVGDNAAIRGAICIPQEFRPRLWQTEALERWRSSMRGIVRVTTGAGKTVFAVLAMQMYRSLVPNGRILIVVPTIALQEQWFVELTEQFGVSEDAIQLVGGDQPQKSADAPICIGLTNTLRKPKNDFSDNTFLVADECHRLGSAENSRVLEIPHNAALGLSATPERDYDDGFAEFIEPSLGPIIYRYDYSDALRDGILAPFKLTNISVPLLPYEKEQYDRLSRAIAAKLKRDAAEGINSQNSSASLRHLLIRRSRVAADAMYRVPVAVKIAMTSTSQCIIFHENTRAADIIAANLQNKGKYAVVYHSKVSPIMRIDNLRLFKRGDAEVLVCCKALDEGLNVPNAGLGIIASSTASTRQRIQRLGRVLRAAPLKKSAEVITLFATDAEKKRLEEEERNLSDVTSVTWRMSRVDKEAYG